MDCSPPASSVHGILQARILEWVAMPSSRGSSWPRDWTGVSYVSCIVRQFLYHYSNLGSSKTPSFPEFSAILECGLNLNSQNSFIWYFIMSLVEEALLQWLSSKESVYQCRRCREPGSFPGLGGSPGKRNGNPLQCSCFKNLMDWGAWHATVHAVANSQTWLSD